MTTAMKAALAGIVLLLGVLFLEGRSASAHAKEAAAQAALAAQAKKTADSLQLVLNIRITQVRRDSASADSARLIAAQAQARSDAAVAEAARLRRRLTIQNDSTVRIAGDTSAHIVPPEVVAQLKADSIAIAQQSVTIGFLAVAVLDSKREAASARAALTTATDRTAATDRENAALAKEVAALQPPKCSTVCGGAIGAGVVLAGMVLLHR